jgi:hypothetical protein
MIQENQFIDRHKYIGGSDVPVIMGVNKFTSAWDLLLEKAQIKEKNFGGNIYTTVGNLLEPRIQKAANIKNVDEITYKRIYEGVPFECHIDGLDHEESQIQEIKVANQTIHECLNSYEWQIRTYMYVVGLNKARLILLRRDGQLKQVVNDIIKHYDLGYLHDFNNLDQDDVSSAIESLEYALNNMVFSTKMLQTANIDHNDSKCELMLKKVRKFWDYKEQLDENKQLHEDDNFRLQFEIDMR